MSSEHATRAEPAWSPRNVVVGVLVVLSALGSSGSFVRQGGLSDNFVEFRAETRAAEKATNEKLNDLRNELRTATSQTLDPLQLRVGQLEAQWAVVRALMEESRNDLKALRQEVQQQQRNGISK